MGETTAIAWTDHTFNPWWGCTNVSPGCDNCYAEAFAKRTGHDVWGRDGGRRFFGDKHWAEPLRWNEKAKNERRRVFCASMADVFENDERLVDERNRLWDLIALTPNLDWQLLTKRPENVTRMVPGHWVNDHSPMWPANVWLGTTVEDQTRATIRVPRLIGVPGPEVRFLSCEPLLGPVDLWPWIGPNYLFSPIHWVICGGESGPHHRPLDLANARVVRDQCGLAAVPFFFKQVGGRTPTAGGDRLDGEVIKQFPGLVTA